MAGTAAGQIRFGRRQPQWLRGLDGEDNGAEGTVISF